MKNIIQKIKDLWFLRKIPPKELRHLVENEIARQEHDYADYRERERIKQLYGDMRINEIIREVNRR